MKISEESIVEFPFIDYCRTVRYKQVSGSSLEPGKTEERVKFSDLILEKTLAAALLRINPEIGESEIEAIIAFLKKPRLGVLRGNKIISKCLTEGVKLKVEDENGEVERAFLILSPEPVKNNYYVVDNFEVHGKAKVVLDVLLFVNGMTLVVVECKSIKLESNAIKMAMNDLKKYQEEIPKVFFYNQLLVATDENQTLVGTFSDEISDFSQLKGTYPFNPQGTLDAQQLAIWGLLNPVNLIDIILNFI